MTIKLPKTHFARNKTNLLVLDLESDLEIKLVDDEGEPVPNKKYELHLADETIIDGLLDENGYALISGDNLDDAKVTFLELDESAWEGDGDQE